MPSPPDPDPDKPGKIRTWWHPLLAGFLRWQLGSHYDLREEVPVGKKPLQIDFLLLHKTQGELSDHARTLLAGLAEYLNEYTLVELKSPSDTLRAGDFRTLLAYALINCAQQPETLEPARQAGYTELVVFMAQQIEQFRRLGKEFAMQHLGSEDEMLQTLKDMYAALPVEERLDCLTTEERLKDLPPERRIEGLSPEQVFEALSPEARDRLKQMMQEQAKVDDNVNPK